MAGAGSDVIRSGGGLQSRPGSEEPGIRRAEEREYQRRERRLRPTRESRAPEGRRRQRRRTLAREEIARHAVGTSGTVANELTVKGVDSRSADDHDGDIRRVLNDKVDNDAVLKDRDINFDVNNGVVTIKGDVRTAAEKQKVGEMAPATENVKDVVNSLDIKNDRTANSQKK
jgi:BON domain